MEKQSVAVIGAGPSGLAILKNLRDEGFDVTVFEKRNSVGGVWAYSDDEKTTSTLPITLSNVSKWGNSFTDFPIPDDLPAHLTSSQTCDYLRSYSAHFDLNQDIKLNSSVKWVKRNAEDTRWRVCITREDGEEIKDFDKVVLCSGLTAKAVIPEFEFIEKFKGKAIHCQAFKRPSDFQNMRVLVVGMGNSAADTSTQLIGSAKKIYLSHRGGAKILPRIYLGTPLDFVITRQKNVAKFTLDKYLPSLGRWLFDWTIEQYSKKSFKLDPSWRLAPAPSLANHQPVMTDNLVSSLSAGNITSVHALKCFVDENKVELTDGEILEVDAVIFCTGYEPDFSIIPDFNPVISSPSDRSKQSNGDGHRPGLARLYQNIFPPKYADSLAFMNYAALTDGAITVIDLATMAIAQIWKGAYQLPSVEEMNAAINTHHQWVKSLARDDSVYTGIVRPGPWYEFLNHAAGTGVDEKLGYGWEGWRFWARDRKLSTLMMTGVMTPFMYRLFDGKGRKKWDGAREAILHSNETAKAYVA